MVASSSYFRFNQVNGHKNVARLLKFSHVQGSAAACLCLPDTAKCGALEAAGNARSRYAVIGAGLAGVATAWHLLEKSDPGHAIEVVIYDAVGVAAGGSGSAAGLLHALNPKGKLLWKGVEGVSATMQLLKAAVSAAAALHTPSTSFSDGCGLTAQEPAWNAGQVQGGGDEDPHVRCRPQEAEQEESSEKSCMGMRDEQYMTKHDEPRPDSTLSTFNQPASFVWTNGLVRPTASLKQANDFVKAAAAASKPATQSTQGKHSDEGAQLLSAESLQLLSSQFEELHHLVGRSNDSKRPASLNMHDSETGVRQQQQQLLKCLTSRELQTMVPGINSNPSWMAEATTHKVQSSRSRSERREQARQQQCTTSGQEVLKEHVSREEAREREQPNSCAGLHVPLGLVVNVKAYLESLLLACTDMAAARGDGSSTTLKIMKEPIRSLTDLEATEGPFTGIVVAGGAASQIITEVRQMGLPLQLCQGYTLVMTPPDSKTCQPGPTLQGGYPEASPSILGQPYLAAWGNQQVVVGATKSYGLLPEEAMQMCYPNTAAKEEAATMAGPEGGEMSILEGCRTKVDPALATCHSLTKDLLEASVRVWKPLSKWKVSEVKSGVRALPPRTSDGSIPLIGRLGSKQSWWFICGLGARGLVYHAWLASIIAGAMIKNDEDQIQPEELLAWKVVVASCEVKFDTV